MTPPLRHEFMTPPENFRLVNRYVVTFNPFKGQKNFRARFARQNTFEVMKVTVFNTGAKFSARYARLTMKKYQNFRPPTPPYPPLEQNFYDPPLRTKVYDPPLQRICLPTYAKDLRFDL